MFYGDLKFIDILIFGAVAVFLFARLWGVLGKRTGYEKKQTNTIETERHNKESFIKTEKKKEIPELEENIKELSKAYDIIENFNHINFLEGAKNAFETIVNLFNEGNKKALQSLLTENTYIQFCKAIDLTKEPQNNQILSLEIESIDKVWAEGKKIFITISYLSKQINNKNENEISKKDVWTFEKRTNSKNPNWLLSST